MNIVLPAPAEFAEPSAVDCLDPAVRQRLNAFVARVRREAWDVEFMLNLMDEDARGIGLSPDDPAVVKLAAAFKELVGWRPQLRIATAD